MHKDKKANNSQENTEQKAKKRTKKQILMQIIAIVIIATAGIGAGFYCGMLYLSSKIPKIDYGKYDEEFLRANAQEIIEKNAGKQLNEITAVDAFVIAQYNTENSNQFIAIADNYLTHNFGKQTVYAYRHKLGNSYLVKEISTSAMKSVANKFISNDGNEILIYNGTPTSQNTAEWSNSYRSLTAAEFKEEMGINAFEIVPFIVSEKTLAEGSKNELGKKLSNGNYQFSLNLDIKSSVINYAKKIRKETSLSGYPSFSQLDLVFEVDSNLRLVSLTSYETYSFSYSGIAVTCTGAYTTIFDYTTTPTDS